MTDFLKTGIAVDKRNHCYCCSFGIRIFSVTCGIFFFIVLQFQDPEDAEFISAEEGLKGFERELTEAEMQRLVCVQNGIFVEFFLTVYHLLSIQCLKEMSKNNFYRLSKKFDEVVLI